MRAHFEFLQGNAQNNANKPPSLFGNTGGGIFGQQQTQPQQANTAFGGTTSAFGNAGNTNTGIFGQQQQQNQQQPTGRELNS